MEEDFDVDGVRDVVGWLADFCVAVVEDDRDADGVGLHVRGVVGWLAIVTDCRVEEDVDGATGDRCSTSPAEYRT